MFTGIIIYIKKIIYTEAQNYSDTAGYEFFECFFGLPPSTVHHTHMASFELVSPKRSWTITIIFITMMKDSSYVPGSVDVPIPTDMATLTEFNSPNLCLLHFFKTIRTSCTSSEFWGQSNRTYIFSLAAERRVCEELGHFHISYNTVGSPSTNSLHKMSLARLILALNRNRFHLNSP